jgi:hypothetical protein
MTNFPAKVGTVISVEPTAIGANHSPYPAGVSPRPSETLLEGENLTESYGIGAKEDLVKTGHIMTTTGRDEDIRQWGPRKSW